MSLTGPLNTVARYARRWQTSTAAITRGNPDAAPVFDEQTGTYTDPPPIEVYTGPCLIRPAGGQRVAEFGEGPVTLRTYDVTLDGEVSDVRVGDDVAIADSRDPALDGLSMVVLDVPKSDHLTNRQLMVEEVVS